MTGACRKRAAPRRLRLPLAIAVVALAGLPAGWADAGVGRVAPDGNVRVWTPQFMGGSSSRTRRQARADARHFPVIAAHDRTYKGHVAAMKRVRPGLKLLVYLNGTATWEDDLAEGAYAHSADGNRIRIKGWLHTYLLNPSSSAAISYQRQRAKSLIASSGYNGLLLDALGAMALRTDYVTALPINPSTGVVWTRSAWLNATRALAARVRDAVSPRPVVGNGLADGAAYFLEVDPSRRLLRSGIAGGEAESWLRGSTKALSSYPPETVWKKNVDMLAHAARRGKSIMTMTKTWTSGTLAKKRAWHRFALGSYLLGNTGRAYFAFSYKNGDSTVARRLNRIKLGKARRSYRHVRGYYQRPFEHGRVYVNPGSNKYRIALHRPYLTLGGRWVSSIVLEGHSAQILRR